MDFTGKIALITGGSSGIGLAVAKEFANRGVYVCLAARREDPLSEALDSLTVNPGGGKTAFSCDVTDREQVSRLIKDVEREAGFPDILVNSAGAAHPGKILDLDLEVYQWMMNTNYWSIVYTTKAVLPGMIQRGSGWIVNIGSLASYIGLIGYSAYGASKFAVRGFTEALRMESRPHGIKVALVLPPDTDTPQLTYENRYKPLELKYLLPELGVISPEKVAKSIIQGMRSGKYEIAPDAGSQAILIAHRLFGSLTYRVLDFLHKRSISRMEREGPRPDTPAQKE